MRIGSPVLGLAALSFALILAGCGGGGASFSYQDVSATLSPQIASVPVNGTEVFTTTVTNAPNAPIWFLDNLIASGASQTFPNAGSLTTTTTDAPSATYTAPSTPPIYTLAQVNNGADSLTQGSVIVSADVASSDSLLGSDIPLTETIAIVGPISSGILPTTASVALGTNQQFYPYVVGTLNQAYTLQVNGVTTGSMATGTIGPTGFYQAPTSMPITGSTVAITVTSTADLTKTATAVITLH